MTAKNDEFTLVFTDFTYRYNYQTSSYEYYNSATSQLTHRDRQWNNHSTWPPAPGQVAATMDYNSTYYKRRYIHLTVDMYLDGVHKTGTNLWIQPGHAGSASNPDQYLTDEDNMWLKLRVKIKEVDWNAAVFIAESQKTVSMLLENAKRFGAAIRYARKGRVVDALRSLGVTPTGKPPKKFTTKQAANRWLEYQYGWRSLVRDVQDAAKAAASLQFTKPITRRVKVGEKETENEFEDVVTIGVSTDFPSHTIHCRRKTKVRTRRQAWAVLRKHNAPVPEALGFDSPLVVAWEVVPFSFVIDWFINIGQWLEGANALFGVDVYDVGQDYYVALDTDCEVYASKFQSSGWTCVIKHHNRYVEQPPEGVIPHYVERRYVRRKEFDIPMPPPSLSKSPLDFTRGVTALALIKQRMRS
jgi:hypothetical protein